MLTETYTDKDELTQHKKKKAELFIGISDNDETELKHKKKVKDMLDMYPGTYDVSQEDQQHCKKRKKAELLIEESDYDKTQYHKTKNVNDEIYTSINGEELKLHKKKKEKKNESLAEKNVELNQHKLEQHKKNEKIESSDASFTNFQSGENIGMNLPYTETYVVPEINFGLMHKHEKKHKKKSNYSTKLSIMTSDETKSKCHNKNKRKKKPNMLTETYTDKDELTQHKKKKAELFIGISDNDETELKHKKEVKDMLDMYPGTYDVSQEDQQHCKKSKKSELLIEESDYDKTQYHKTKNVNHEIYTSINGEELKLHKKKKKKKTKSLDEKNVEFNEHEFEQHKKNEKIVSPDASFTNFQSGENIGMNLPYTETYVVPEINFGLMHKHEKKHKKKSKENGNKMETPIKDNIKHSQRQNKHKLYGDISESELSNGDYNSSLEYSHKKKRHLKNSKSIANKFNDNAHDRKINKKYQTVGVTDCNDNNSNDLTVENLQNSTEIKDSPCFENVEHTYFSSYIDDSEDPVDFEIPPLHQFETVCKISEKQKDVLLTSEVFIKTGKFMAAEDEIIRKNFECFIKKYGVSDPFSLLGIGRKVKDPEIFKFVKAKHFYVRLAKDLNDRTLHSIYKRARIILHPYRNSEKLTEKEIAHLKRLYENFSNNWHQIGDTLGYTAERCAHAYKWHEKNIAKGKFTEEEETKLIKALRKVSGSSDISCKSIRHINWDKIASYIPSRNSSQCRLYWANNLAWSPGSARKNWNGDCCRKLVHTLKEMNVQDSSEINWFKVYEQFEDFAPSDFYVLKRWLYLRSRIPNYKNKTFKEIVEILCNQYYYNEKQVRKNKNHKCEEK